MSFIRRTTFRSHETGRSATSKALVTLIAFGMLLSLLTIVPDNARAAAATLEVDDDAAPGWYDATHVRTIAEAIANATAGDNILVHPGTYAESVTISKKLNIYSIGGAAVTTVISAASRAISITASYANLTGLTVTGGASTGIFIDLNHVTIAGCIVSGARTGIDIDGQYTSIVNCTVTGYQRNAIESYSRSNIKILNSTFQNAPLVETYSGISILSGSNIIIRNCSLLDSTLSGISISESDSIVLENNTAQGNGKGIALSSCEGVFLRNNTMTGNGWDLRITGGTLAELSPDIDASNLVTNGPVRYYVGQPGVAVDADAGYLALVDCDGVRVSNMTFSNNGAGVFVAYSDAVELDAIVVEACEYGVYFTHCVGLRMEGCRINGSEEDGIRGYIGDGPFFGNCTVLNTGPGNFKDGAYLAQIPNATFYRCNISDSGGYGIYLTAGHNATIVDNDFWNNVGGVGVYVNQGPDSVVRNNTIRGCSMGVDVDGGSHRSLVEGNRALYNNLGSTRIGIGVISSYDCQVRNNTVYGHTYGLWIRDTTDCQVTNNDVEGNSWYAIWVRGSTGTYVADNMFESSSSTYYSVTLDSASSGCTVVNNKIIGPRCAQDQGSGNVWNTTKTLGTNIVGGPYLGGNYYSAYTGSDADLDGIGDTPFAIAGGASVDHLPLVQKAEPSPPRNLMATPGNAQVSLQWTAPADDGGSPITKYSVYRGPTSGSLSLLAELGVALSYLDSAVTNGQTYYYAVTATNAIGESGKSNVAQATPSVPVTVPTVTITSPANNSVNQGSAQLVWTGSDSGSGIAYYEVQLDSQAWINKSMATTHSFSSLASGAHQLKVRAWNEAGRSRTAWITVTSDLTPPAALAFAPTGQSEPLDVAITVTMSEEMATFVATVNGASASASWSGLVATLTPSSPLQYSTNYQVRVNGTDLAGWPMSELVYGFRTMDEPMVLTVVGMVAEENGDPVAGATVTAGDQTDTTDAEGHFELQLAAGSYTITATKGDRTKGIQFVVTEESTNAGTIVLPAEEAPDSGGIPFWTWILLIIIVVVVFIFFLIFWKRRKKDEEEEEKRKKQ